MPTYFVLMRDFQSFAAQDSKTHLYQSALAVNGHSKTIKLSHDESTSISRNLWHGNYLASGWIVKHLFVGFACVSKLVVVPSGEKQQSF